MNTLPSALGDVLDEVIRWAAARLRSQWWVWLIPFGVLYAMVRWPATRILHITAAVIALGVLAWAIRRPAAALGALVVFLPLQAIGFGFLLRLHVPGQILRPAGALKELLGVGILIAALHTLHVDRVHYGRRAQLDAIDKALLLYVGVVTLYLIVPHLFTTYPVSNRWSVRLLSWRADCGYVLLFFGVRHAPITAGFKRRFGQILLVMALLTVTLAFYQWARPNSWSHLILISGRQIQYQINVLGNNAARVQRNLGYLNSQSPLRVSSIFLSPFDMADFLLIAFAVGIERIARNFRPSGAYLLCAAILVALFASRVRADALAAVVIAIVALAATPNRPIAARLRLLASILLAAAVIVPAIGGTRFVNAEGGGKSSSAHVTEFSNGVSELVNVPLGLGIGNVAGVGDRFLLGAKNQGSFTIDNAVLQVGDELGIQALLPWLILVILVWRALGKATKRADAFAGGIRLAFLAVLIAGMYHHVFLGFPVAWLLWAAIGLALKPEETAPGDESDRSMGNIVSIDAAAADGQS